MSKVYLSVTLSIAVSVALSFLVYAYNNPLTVEGSDKEIYECTGYETAGHCADKCPHPAYTIGYDKTTGVPICKTITGCVWGDSIPLDQCDKHAPPKIETQEERIIGK